MFSLIIVSIVSFFCGFIISFLIFKKKKEDSALFIMLKDFKNTIEEYKNQTTLNTKEINNAIKTASDLTNKLTTNQNLKGQFGEECLEAILKTCYPSENLNYFKQFKTQNESKEEIKPDFVVNLPNNKSIVIDCKLNLDKYLNYKENSSLKNEFVKDLNATINALSNKKYQSANSLKQPDFILMYIPLEPVLTTIYTDKDFLSVIKNANDKNIIIVGNSSILTTIRLTKLLWAQQTQAENIEKIIDTAQNIYEYIAVHTQNLYNIKATLNENTQIFNKEYEKFSSNNKFFKLAEELKQCGIQTGFKKEGKKLNKITIHPDFIEKN